MAAKSYALSLPPLKGGDNPYSVTYAGIGKLTRFCKTDDKGKPIGKPVSNELKIDLLEAQAKSLHAKGVIFKPPYAPSVEKEG